MRYARPFRGATSIERKIHHIISAHRRDYPTGPNELQIKREQDSIVHRYELRQAAARIAAATTLVLLMAAGTAQAQTAPLSCKTAAATTPLINPTTIVFVSLEHPLVANYTIGVVDAGVNPNGTALPFASQTVLPLASVVAVPDEPSCYSAPIPLAVQASLMLLKQFQATIKLVRTDGAESPWSDVSNPFVKAGPATAVTGVRVRKL